MSGNGNKFIYLVGIDKYGANSYSPTSYIVDRQEKTVYFLDALRDNYATYTNYRHKIGQSGTTEYIQLPYKRINSVVKFPAHSVESVSGHVHDYSIEYYTYINGWKIVLASYIVNRYDVLCDKPLKMYANEYYEQLSFSIIDPFDLCYSDNWQDFRANVCGEPTNINNTGSLLSIAINPVVHNEEIYINDPIYNGGSNSIMIVDPAARDLALDIKFVNKPYLPVGISYAIRYNTEYASLQEYLGETYFIDDFQLKAELVVKDDDNVYAYYHIDNAEETGDFDNISFEGWSDYGDGMIIECIVTVIVNGADVLYINSNRVPLTPEIFKFLINGNNIYNINKINLNLVNMKVYDINAINTIKKEIVEVGQPESYKSNIIMPVFFRAQKTQNITVHPAVTENIAIRLDEYKSKVKAFMLQIEGVTFIEVGRTGDGVIFSVIGSKLPKEIVEGDYYILDNKGVSITSGKYKYA